MRGHPEVMAHRGPQGPEQIPDLRLGPDRSGYRLPGFGLFSLKAFDLAVDLVQGLVDLTRTYEHVVRRDHLRLGVSVTMGSFSLIECLSVGLFDTAFSHDVQMLVERRGELTCIPIELHVAGTSEQ
ncbi:hypothetical protein AQI88_39130 [Streptomyces cellostaticus]|uniref:Uncharacterized protein n=1 Tax=Streptomyces cellostaticus TaxID=67285 RepID=A0A101NBX8_9ACTN|nr:hypothetical protein AQI88_39130 [Streptomyces cellostaticus]